MRFLSKFREHFCHFQDTFHASKLNIEKHPNWLSAIYKHYTTLKNIFPKKCQFYNLNLTSSNSASVGFSVLGFSLTIISLYLAAVVLSIRPSTTACKSAYLSFMVGGIFIDFLAKHVVSMSHCVK